MRPYRWRRFGSRGLTLLEMLWAVGLSAVVIVIATTLYMAVLGTERLSREVLGSTPEAGLVELLEDLSSCGSGAVGPDSRETGGIRWWRTEVCVRAYAVDVQSRMVPSGYILRLRSAADRAAVEQLWPLTGGPGVLVRTAGGCVCRVDFREPASAEDADLTVRDCGGCAPTPGPLEARVHAQGPGRLPPGLPVEPVVLLAQVVVVPPGGRLPSGAPPAVSPQGVSLLFGWSADEPPAHEPFPERVVWLPVYAHWPSGSFDAGRTWEAWGSRHLVAGDLPGGGGLTTADLDADGDGEVGPGEAPAQRLVPMSALEGWVLWMTRAGTLRKQVPVRCGILEIPAGDRRECTVRSFRPF